MASRVYPIDWREELAQLGPYLKGRGGVVRVRYAGERCAPSAFLATLTSEYEFKDDNRNWQSIRIDHQVYSVRYLSGIRDEFLRKIRLRLPKAYGISEASASLAVLTDVAAGGDVHADVSNLTLNQYSGGDNAALLSEARDRWIKPLCEQVAEFLNGGHMMVVVNHGSRESQDEFWRYLWRDGLERLAISGLLLVHMIDVSDASAHIHDLAPPAHVDVDLPAALGVAAQDHAIEDLTGFILREIPRINPDQARAAAHALVVTHADDIPRLHGKYFGYLLTLRRDFG